MTIVENLTSKILLVGIVVMLAVCVVSASDVQVTPIKISEPQNQVVGFSTVEVIDEHTGETLALYIVGDE